MGARLAATVYVKRPGTAETVRLDAGTEPEPELAALVTNPGAWEGGELPALPKAKADTKPADTKTSTPDPSGDDEEDSTADKKPARKTAARKPAAD
jgi:hypothetical protein